MKKWVFFVGLEFCGGIALYFVMAPPAGEWMRLKRDRLDGQPGIYYLDREWEMRPPNRIKFRLKYVYDQVQTDAPTTLKYKEFLMSMEANCGTGRTRHLVTMAYGPKGGVVSQIPSPELTPESRDALGQTVCSRAA